MNTHTADPELSQLLEHLRADVVVVDGDLRLRQLLWQSTPRTDAEPSSLEALALELGDADLITATRHAVETGEASEAELRLASHRIAIRRISVIRAGPNTGGACITYQDRPATLDRARSQAAHDLRSPLSVILMWAKLLRTRPMNDQQRNDGLDTVIRNAETQRDLIERHLGRDPKA